MGRNRFVTSGIKRLELSDGDWVEVKDQLGLAEAKRLESALFRGIRNPGLFAGRTNVNPDEIKVDLDDTMAFMAKLHTYVVAWSFRDENDKPVEVTHEAIENLDPATGNEIVEALNAYLEERDKARAESPFTVKKSRSRLT